MASTKFINECKNSANSNRLGKISVETIKKVSGTKLELSNTLDKKISPRLKGYTKQNVYSGKNKNVNAENVIASASSPANSFANLTEYDGYKNVVEVSTNIAYMTLRVNEVSNDLTEAISTGGIDITSMLLIKKTNANTAIKLYLGDITGGAIYNELKHYKDEANGWAWYYTTHTIPANPSIKTIRYHLSASNVGTFYVAKIQTLIGSTPGDFEPYVGGKATPRADMPQEIEVVAKNLFNVYKSSDGFIGNNNGDILAPNTASKEKTSDFIEVNQNEVIVCNLKATIPSDGYIWWGYIYYDINKIPITERQSIHNASNKLSLTVPLNAKYLRVSTRLYNDGILTIRKNTIITTKTTTKNLLKNSSFRENFDGWNHHGSVEITEKLGQKCMHIPCQLGTGAITSVRDIKDIVKHDNIYTLSAYVYAENIVAGTTNPTFAFYIDGKKIDGTWTNGLVTIKGSPNFKAYNYSNGFTKVSWTFKINTDLDLSSPFRLYVYTRDHTGDLYLYNLQLEPGDIDTEYQEYQESSIQYSLGDNFLADKDYIENGVLNKHIGKVVLNGNEEWLENSASKGKFQVTLSNIKNIIKGSISNYFKQSNTSINGMENNSVISYSGNRLYFRFDNYANDLTGFKAWLKEKYDNGTPVIVYYELATPEQIPLETTGELRTYESNTIISNDSDIEMEVEYSSWDTEITNGDNLTDVSIEDSCYVDGQIIGTTFEKKATSQLIAVPNDVDLIDKKIKVEIGVKYGDLSNEMVKMGNYTIERPKDEQTENFTQITAYDDFNSLDNPYVCNLDFSKDVTIADFYIDVCNQLELTPMKTTFLNSDIKVTANPFVNKETLRVVLQEIEKVSCTFSEIDYETNKIDLVWLSENEEPDYEFATNDYTTLEGGKITYGPVNCLVIKESQIEGENTVRQDDESITANGETQIAIQDSYFLFTQALREQAIDNIWNRVKGLTYVDCKLITSYGKPFLKVGNKIRVNVNDGRVFDTYVLKHTFKYDGAFESTIESPALTKQETKVKSKSISESIRLTEIRVDKAEGNIKATTKKVESIDTTVNNNYQDIINKFGEYTPTNKVIEIENSIEQLQTDTYTKTEINTKLTDGSVTKVMTTSGTFDENGMHYEKTGAPTKSTINESGVNVESSTTGEELLFAGYDKELEQTIVRTENLTVRNYLVIGSNSRIEDYEDENGNAGGGIFIL